MHCFRGFSPPSLRDIGTLPNDSAVTEILIMCKRESLPTAVQWHNSHGTFAVRRSAGIPTDLIVTAVILPKKRSGSPQTRSIMRGIVPCTWDIRLRAQSSSSLS